MAILEVVHRFGSYNQTADTFLCKLSNQSTRVSSKLQVVETTVNLNSSHAKICSDNLSNNFE